METDESIDSCAPRVTLYRERFGKFLKDGCKLPALSEGYSRITLDFELVPEFDVRVTPCHQITITSGAVYNVAWLCWCLMGDPSFLPYIGSPNKEKNWYKGDLSWFSFYEDMRLSVLRAAVKGIEIPEEKVIDETRKDYAQWLEWFILDFLFFHEVAHSIYGHGEFIGSNKRELAEITRQVLELNADYYSIQVTYGCWTAPKFVENTFFKKKGGECYAVSTWATAFSLLFTMMEERSQHTTHPSAACRVLHAFDVTTTLARNKSQVSDDILSAAWDRALDACVDAAKRLGVPSRTLESIQEYEKARDEYNSLLTQWHVIRSSVNGFTRIGLPERSKKYEPPRG